ncbi:hypothetical protein [Nocardia sp. NPDC051832]|uniref:hypothetical protein n=1 Tax=Nocardia sp. NPDC051832 TaxID=3155673 RepID=UPI00343A32CA
MALPTARRASSFGGYVLLAVGYLCVCCVLFCLGPLVAAVLIYRGGGAAESSILLSAYALALMALSASTVAVFAAVSTLSSRRGVR